MNKASTAWEKSGSWYHKIVGEKGHFFHQTVVIPKSLKLLNLKNDSSLLDIACGQGVIAGYLPKTVYYLGIDASESLIRYAQTRDKNRNHHYTVADVTKNINFPEKDFTHAAIILALQNISEPEKAINFASRHLKANGKLLIILNHPSFRIPRQSSWEIDNQNKLQYRKVNRYLSPLKIPLTVQRDKIGSPIIWSFHHPLSDYSRYLFENGFLIEKIEEWISPKTSVGKAAKQENHARGEFPLFMAVLAVKK